MLNTLIEQPRIGRIACRLTERAKELTAQHIQFMRDHIHGGFRLWLVHQHFGGTAQFGRRETACTDRLLPIRQQPARHFHQEKSKIPSTE
jgi:hypothetical protein